MQRPASVFLKDSDYSRQIYTCQYAVLPSKRHGLFKLKHAPSGEQSSVLLTLKFVNPQNKRILHRRCWEHRYTILPKAMFNAWDISKITAPAEVFLFKAILILSPEANNHFAPLFNCIWFIQVPFALESVIKALLVSAPSWKVIVQCMPDTRRLVWWKSHFSDRPIVYCIYAYVRIRIICPTRVT